jgi:octaheme c-type cytochrome (tetrathionate reductase family)
MMHRFWHIRFLVGLPIVLCLLSGVGFADDADSSNMHFRDNPPSQPTQRNNADTSTADHSKFEILQQPFADGPSVTKACLSCHTEAGEHVMKSIHWTWEYEHPKTGQKLGKKHLVNTFCTNARGNEGMCAQCHAGYGWKDETFDFNNPNNIDCLVCHDRTGSYYKTPNSPGNEACSVMFKEKPPIQWSNVAQKVGLPGRDNCGRCHFYGGGGDGVKHGDLDSSLEHPNRALDVHMDADGLNFACTQCHVSDKHIWAGSRYQVVAKDMEGAAKPGMRRDVATCESCHGTAPHPVDGIVAMKLNDHVNKVACQTCHIPTIARGGVATNTKWDWRTAGKTKDGEGYKEDNYIQANGKARSTYKSIKGSFEWAENFVPYYAWFDGQMNYTTIDTVFDPNSGSIDVNGFNGSADDPQSRIWPFKPMHTIQPYDKGLNTLVYMHLWGNDKDAYWGNYDFGRAIKAGMEKNNLPYSGEYGFVDTYSYWPITHTVAPKENALDCGECHSKAGRLQEVKGFYLPGRDSPYDIDRYGLWLLLAALLGIVVHATLRGFTGRQKS